MKLRWIVISSPTCKLIKPVTINNNFVTKLFTVFPFLFIYGIHVKRSSSSSEEEACKILGNVFLHLAAWKTFSSAPYSQVVPERMSDVTT